MKSASCAIGVPQVIRALSDGLDMVGNRNACHGKRVARMVDLTADLLGWPSGWRSQSIQAALVHDCGVSSSSSHFLLLDLHADGTDNHSEVGAQLLESVPVLAPLARIVRMHHARWSDLAAGGFPGATAVTANLIHLADRLEVLTAPGSPSAVAPKAALATLEEECPGWFAPELFAGLRAAASSPGFWTALNPVALEAWLDRTLVGRSRERVDFDGVYDIAGMFARLVDAKSRFTARHSLGVGQIGRVLAQRLGLDGPGIEVAGMLHDIGKLRVPDHILEKPGPLTATERQEVERHSIDTAALLHRLLGDHPLVGWAAHHHESLSGDGYPYGLDEAELSIEARVVAVADVFQALAQNRPYRPSMTLPQIMTILDRLVAERKIDGDVVAAVRIDPDEVLAAGVDPDHAAESAPITTPRSTSWYPVRQHHPPAFAVAAYG